MDDQAAMILLVDFDAMVFVADARLVQKANYAPPQLSAPLPRNNFHQPDFLGHRQIDHTAELFGDRFAVIENIVEIQSERRHSVSISSDEY